MHQDKAGRDIEVGDFILYTASAGQSVSSINIGKVTRFTAKTIWVQDHKTDLTPEMRQDGYMRPSGRFWTGHNGSQHEYNEFVATGEVEVGETTIVAPRPDRFWILKKT